jgi:hypothetical protein
MFWRQELLSRWSMHRTLVLGRCPDERIVLDGVRMNRVFHVFRWLRVAITVAAAMLCCGRRPVLATECVYVGGFDGVGVIDAETLSVVANIPGGAGLIAIDHDRLRGYFASSTISVVDLRTNAITASICWPSGLAGAHQLVLSPDGAHLYAFVGNTLLVIDTATRSVSIPPVDLTANNGEPLMDITPDGKFLYVARQFYGLSVVDTTTFEIVDNITNYPPGLFPFSVAIRADGRTAYTLGPNNTVSIIDMQKNEVVGTRAITGCMRIDDIDNNCGTAYVTVNPIENFTFYAVNAIDESIARDGTVLTRLGDDFKYATTYPHPVFLAFSRDGRTEAVAHSELDRVSDPNFIWVQTAKVPGRVGPQRVWFSEHNTAVYSDHALAIADVPSGCAGVPIPCPGDCDGSRTVTVDELMTGVHIALGEQSYVSCLALDADHNGQVTVDELTGAVDTALNGCTAPTPTPVLLPVCPSNTPVPTPTPTPTPTPCDGCTPTPTPTITLTPTNTFPP